MRRLRAVKIDVDKNIIQEVDIGEGIDDIKRNIGCDLFTVAGDFKTKDNRIIDSLYVDDEGLLCSGKKVFQIKFPGTSDICHFAGNGLVIGVDLNDGESTDARISLFDLASCIEWTSLVVN